MTGLDIPAQLLMACLLVHLRFTGFMFFSPLFLATGMPIPFRFLFTTVLTATASSAFPAISIPTVLFENWIPVFLMVLREFFIGAALGLLSALPLTALQISGEKIGTAMGISMASVMDPLTQRQTSILDQFQYLIGLWFYFRWNGHLLMIQALTKSLELIPIASLNWIPSNHMEIANWFTAVFILGVRIVIPFYCALLLADVGLGFLARTVPQMNIFVLGLPMKLALGFFVLAAILPLTVDMVYGHMERWIEFALASVTAWR